MTCQPHPPIADWTRNLTSRWLALKLGLAPSLKLGRAPSLKLGLAPLLKLDLAPDAFAGCGRLRVGTAHARRATFQCSPP